MKHSLPIKTRGLAIAACVSMVALLAACTNSDGYYDSDGRFVPYTVNGKSTNPYSNGKTGNEYNARPDASYTNQVKHQSRQPYSTEYSRRGYYDYDGDYVTDGSIETVPASMFPPRGKCRVWFTDRQYDRQPGIESCDGIRNRVPSGAYVIYGG